MPSLLKIDSYAAINLKERAELADAEAAGSTSIELVNAQGVAEDDFLYIGRLGQEKVEKRQAGTVTGNTVAVSALTYSHAQYGPVTALLGDQIQVYRAANVDGTAPADDDFSALGSPVDIDPDQAHTEHTDATGSSAFWYKWVYYNSDSAAEVTTLDQVKAVRGAEYGNYTTVAAIKVEAGIQDNPYISDGYVAQQRAEAQSVINAALKGIYTIPFAAPVPEIIGRMTKLLAAGYILKGEFGDQAVGTNADGQAKINEVMSLDEDNPGLLTQIINGTLLVTDEAGASSASRDRISGWPNSTTKDADVADGGGRRKFRIGHIY